MHYPEMPFFMPPLFALNVLVAALVVGVPVASLLGAIVIRAASSMMAWDGPGYWEAFKASIIANLLSFAFLFSFLVVIGRGRASFEPPNDPAFYVQFVLAILLGHAVVFANVLKDRARQGPGTGRALYLALVYTAVGLAGATMLAFMAMIAAPPV